MTSPITLSFDLRTLYFLGYETTPIPTTTKLLL